MIVAITGGTGFIGRKLALRHLSMGDEIRVLSRKCEGLPDAVKWHKGDLLESGSLSGFVDNADVLYHCAGQLTDTYPMRKLHVDATERLAKIASGRIGHWVQLSSVGVYGPVFSGVVTEESPVNPVGEYESTKAESDRIVENAADNGAFTCSILRPSNVFGTEMRNQSLFSMIEMIDRRLFFFIGRHGASANYIHVDNVVEGLVRCATLPQAKGKIFNLSDHRTMETFVGTITEALGRPVPRIRLPKAPVAMLTGMFGEFPGFPLTLSRINALSSFSVYAIDAIMHNLGYRHIVSMEEGIRELVEAYKCQK